MAIGLWPITGAVVALPKGGSAAPGHLIWLKTRALGDGHLHGRSSRECRSAKRIGEEVAEKLDYAPGVFSVERHVRGKWVCSHCETLVQAPVAPHIIDKGVPTTSLLAHVLIAKFVDHLPLYRQEAIFGRAGLAIPRSTLAQWVGTCGVQLQALVDALHEELLTHAVLHADETPVAMLSKGKTHKAYLWSYCTTAFDPVKAVVFDFAESRAGQHARDFLGIDTEEPGSGWHGTLVCDDYSGYKAGFGHGAIEAGCLAHARRKFHELWVNHQSAIGEQALEFFRKLYDVERDAKDMTPDERRRLRQEQAEPIANGSRTGSSRSAVVFLTAPRPRRRSTTAEVGGSH